MAGAPTVHTAASSTSANEITTLPRTSDPSPRVVGRSTSSRSGSTHRQAPSLTVHRHHPDPAAANPRGAA
jgi:hypothetical protein